MSSKKSWLARAGQTLADRLDRLRYDLESMHERLRAAVAQAVGQTIADIVQDAVNAVLDTPSYHHDSPDRRYGSPGYARATWQDAQDPVWRDHPDYWHEWDEEEVPQRQAPTPKLESRASGLGKALMVGCETAAWWLRRWTGRYSALAALGIGLATAAVTYTGGPLTGAAIGLAGAALGLLNLGETVQAGALALASNSTV